MEGEVPGDIDGGCEAVELSIAGCKIEDELRYDEPEPVNFAINQWLGDALHEAGRYAEAEEAFRHELTDHPHNGWSLFGIERALRAQGKDAEADAVQVEFQAAWARSDTYIRGPVF